ncbi:MAG TPA: hypothetical protein VHA78_05730 [Candidatus Peribacteraceae bacterium]|nr:hypothetical protein [Candidatus Peribacteraceae bacterium]
MLHSLFDWLLRVMLQPGVAHAQYVPPSGIISQVSLGMPVLGFPGIAGAIVTSIQGVILLIGTLLVIRSGFSLISSQQEDKLERAKRIVLSTLVGIMLFYISNTFVVAFFFPGGAGLDAAAGASTVSVEIAGLINWVLVLVGVVGALMVVVSAIKIVANFGKDQGVAEIRRTVFAVAMGIVMIMIRPVIEVTVGVTGTDLASPLDTTPNATSIIGEVAHIVAGLLLYLALVAIAVIIYAGVMLILTTGSEEQFNKSRSLIIRAVIGLIIIGVSYVFALFVQSLVG